MHQVSTFEKKGPMRNELLHFGQFVVLFIVVFTKWNQYLSWRTCIQQLVHVQTTTKKETTIWIKSPLMFWKIFHWNSSSSSSLQDHHFVSESNIRSSSLKTSRRFLFLFERVSFHLSHSFVCSIRRHRWHVVEHRSIEIKSQDKDSQSYDDDKQKERKRKTREREREERKILHIIFRLFSEWKKFGKSTSWFRIRLQ